MEVVRDVISGANVGQVGMDVPVKLGDSSPNGYKIHSGEVIGCDIFERFLNFDNCQLEVVSDVISDPVWLIRRSVWMHVPILVTVG